MNTSYYSNIHIPEYAGLLSINVTSSLRITAKSLSNILCDIYLGLDAYFKEFLFSCLQVLHQFYFLSFPLFFCIQHCSLICAMLPIFVTIFFLLFFVCVCVCVCVELSILFEPLRLIEF